MMQRNEAGSSKHNAEVSQGLRRRISRWRKGPEVFAVAAELDVLVSRRIGVPPPPERVRPTIRPLCDSDAAALVEMLARCSPETLRRRFHAGVEHLGSVQVSDLLRGSGALTHVVADADGAIVGIASLHRHRAGRAAEPEMAVLVEDGWQGFGVGHRLVGRLLSWARSRSIASVSADVLREPGFLLDRLRTISDGTEVQFDGPNAVVHIPLVQQPAAGAP